jgi:hypothetical protein
VTGKRGLFAAAALLILVFAGCGKGSATNAPPAANVPINMTRVVSHVRVLNAGAAPRQLLQLHLTKGAVYDSSMTLRLTLGISIAGNTLPDVSTPPFTLGMRTVVSDVTPTGTTVDLTFKSVDVESTGNPQVVSAMKEAGKKFVGLHARTIIDPSGNVISSGLENGGGVTAAAEQLASSFKQQSQTLSIPFPTTPVGKGAKWITTTSTEFQGIHGTETTTFILRDITGSVVHLTILSRAVIPAQRAALPGLPAGASITVARSYVRGGGLIDTDLGQPMPMTFDQAESGTIIMDLKQGTRQQRMLMRVTEDTKITSTKA